MPTILDAPPANVETDLNRLVQALDTIVPFQRVPELITARSNDQASQLNPLISNHIANAKTIRR